MTENRGAAINVALHSFADTGVVRAAGWYPTDVDDLWSALTSPKRLAEWYGNVEGNLRVGGEFSLFVYGSEWVGRGRVESCVPSRRFEVTTWEARGAERTLVADTAADADRARLALEVRGLPLDVLWAFGAGWHVHLEGLGAHLAGEELPNSNARMEELVSSYQAMRVRALED